MRRNMHTGEVFDPGLHQVIFVLSALGVGLLAGLLAFVTTSEEPLEVFNIISTLPR